MLITRAPSPSADGEMVVHVHHVAVGHPEMCTRPFSPPEGRDERPELSYPVTLSFFNNGAISSPIRTLAAGIIRGGYRSLLMK